MTKTKLTDGNKMRKITINGVQEEKFPDNSIKTAKYNLLTFLPLALFYQFASYFNIFFLITAILLSTNISPIDPGSANAPFILVLVVSLIGEAIEDLKKAKYDEDCNNSISLQYDEVLEEFAEITWKEIAIGKIVKVLRNELIPADLLIIKSSNESGFCYLQTTNLDGESALKPREAVFIFQEAIKSESDFENLGKCYLEIDPPNNNIYKAEGCLTVESLIRNDKVYFDINNILLRGGTLKNIDYIYGVVIYTGKETKMMQNIKHGSLKLSNIEAQLNKIILVVIIVTLIICILCTVFGMIFWDDNKSSMIYIYYTRQKGNTNTFTMQLLYTFAAFFAIFNTLIPISIIIIMQIVKTAQVLFISSDPMLKLDPKEKVKILSMKLHEDLGNVRYIFSDKTGTLTRNEMEFKACSIFSKLYDQEKNSIQSDSESLTVSKTFESYSKLKKSIFSSNFEIQNLRETLILEHPIEINHSFSPFKSMKDAALEFFLNIAINHNVLTETDNKTGDHIYTGSNPDEVVLVQAAKELGIEFIERSGKWTKIKIFDEVYIFEILHRFEYTSARMRSSIIVKDQFNVIKLYMKGADSIILKKIDEYSQRFLFKETKEHLEKFAKSGLRTLCFSMKTLDEEKLALWEQNYKKVQDIAIKDKTMVDLLDKTVAMLEDEMLLIGVSGLEDKLQEDVKNVLHEFVEAGINVWMLTGDKLDTAESIGYSCKLFKDDTEVFKIKAGQEKEETLKRVSNILDTMNIMEKELLDFKIKKKIKKKRGEEFKVKKKQRTTDILILNNNKYNNQIVDPRTSENEQLDMIKNTENNITKRKNPIMSVNNQSLGNLKRKNSPEPKKSTLLNSSRSLNTLTKKRPPSGRIYDGLGNPLDIDEMNNQIINEHMKFIGSNVDSKTNLVTLNFIKTNSLEHTGADKSQSIISIKKNRPVSSNIANLKKRNLDFPRLDNHKETSVVDTEESVEADDVDIIKFMLDKNFFEENLGEEKVSYDPNNFTFLKNIVGPVQIKKSLKDENWNTMRNFENNENHSYSNIKMKYPIKDDKGLHIAPNLQFESIKSSERENFRNEQDDGNYDYNEIDPEEHFDKDSVSLQQKKLNFNKAPKNFNVNEELQINRGKNIENNIFRNNVSNVKNKPYSKDLLKEDESNADVKGNFDFSNLYAHYQEQIKNLESKNTYNLLGFNFEKSNENNESSNITMKNFGLIIEGAAISQCLEKEIAPVFWECLKKSRSIICCRCAPIQKSEVVSYVRKQSGEVTLAIGDGGNDVNMIKAAHVGVGIFGKEGYQAAFNSDYAISQFKYLKRLLFVHGRLSLLRNSYFVNYYFYKNVMFTIPQFWFALFNGYSGSFFWDTWYYLAFNSVITTLPICIRTLFEEDIDISFQGYPDRHILNELVPNIYNDYRNSRPFSIPKFFSIFLGGVIHSFCIYFLPFFINSFEVQDNMGRALTLWDYSLLSYFSMVVIQYFIIIEDTFYMNIIGLFGHFLQIILYIMFLCIYEAINGGQLSGTTYDCLSNLRFWLAMIITVYISIIPVMVARRIETLFSDSLINNLRHKKYEHDYSKKIYMKKLSEMKKYSRSLAKFKKIYNLKCEFEPDNLADKKIKDMVENYKKSKKRNLVKPIQVKKALDLNEHIPKPPKKKHIKMGSIMKNDTNKKENDKNQNSNIIARMNQLKLNDLNLHLHRKNIINRFEENQTRPKSPLKEKDQNLISTRLEKEINFEQDIETRVIEKDDFSNWPSQTADFQKLEELNSKSLLIHEEEREKSLKIPLKDSDIGNQNVEILEEEKSDEIYKEINENAIINSQSSNNSDFPLEQYQTRNYRDDNGPKTTPLVNSRSKHQNFFEIIEEESRDNNPLEFTLQTVKNKDANASSNDLAIVIAETPAFKNYNDKPIIHEYPLELSNVSSNN